MHIIKKLVRLATGFGLYYAGAYLLDIYSIPWQRSLPGVCLMILATEVLFGRFPPRNQQRDAVHG